MNKVPINKNAVRSRIQRKLDKQGKILKKCSPNSKWFLQLGYYYIVDSWSNSIVASGCSLEGLSKELGCLKEYEEIV